MVELQDVISLNIEIADKDLGHFIDSGYNLYITRNVEADGEEQEGNVVFCEIPTDVLAPTQELQWTESYKVFETLQAGHGVVVKAGTHIVEIEGGKTVAFDKEGVGHVTGSAESGQPFKVLNQWKDWASVGVSNYNGNRKADVFTPIYVSSPNPINATSSLLPIKRFNVFWGKSLTTSTIIDVTTTPTFKVDLTGGQKTIRYESGWKDV